jgi:hypothetical protein
MTDPFRYEEPLLSEILSEGIPAGFEETLLAETLRCAQARRRRQKVLRAGAFAALLALGLGLVWRQTSRNSSRPRPVAVYQVVHTTALPANQIVRTTFGTQIVRTVATRHAFQIIDDQQLLALLGPRSAKLVRIGEHSERLIFTAPPDRREPAEP